MGLEDDALPFEFGVLEVEEESDVEAGDFKIVNDLGFFVVAERLHNLGVDDDLTKHDEIRDVFADVDGFVNDRKTRLLLVGDVLQLQLDH